jgi:hypothetical protein
LSDKNPAPTKRAGKAQQLFEDKTRLEERIEELMLEWENSHKE